MSEVIYVDFRPKTSTPDLDKFVFDFVEILNDSCLVDDDIEDIVDAVEDKGRYDDLDPDLKAIVDYYFNGIYAI